MAFLLAKASAKNVGKLHTLFMSQVCMCRNSSFLPKRLSAFHANQASELAAYDLARQQCEEDEISKQLHSVLPGSINGGKDWALPVCEAVCLVHGSRPVQIEALQIDCTDEA